MESKESMTYFGQKNNPFILSMNLKELDKNKANLIIEEKEKGYINNISSTYKTEILALKNYIQKMNILIRNNFNMEIIPSLEEGFASFSKKIKNGDEHSEKFQEVINEWLNKLLNVDYLNPLITLYEEYIKNLEEELKKSKDIIKRYETDLAKIVNENNDLRNQIQISEEELKNFLEVRNESGDGSSMIIFDRDYIMKLEERNQLLSKENEILVVNYNKLQNDFIQLKNELRANGIEHKDMRYDQLNQQHIKLINDYNILQGQFNVNNQKFNEIANKNDILAIENQKLRDIKIKDDNKINTYREANQKYEYLLNKK